MQSFTAHIPLLVATTALGLGRRRWSSPQQCYLHCLHTIPFMPSVQWRCWLGGRNGIRPVKTEWWGAGVVICLERVADLMPLPITVPCFSKIQIGFTFLVPAVPGSPGKKVVKRARARACVCVRPSIPFILSLYQTKIIVHSYWCKYDLVIFTITMCTKLEVQCSLVSRSYNYDLLN